MNKKTEQFNLSPDEVFETMNNMPRKYLLSKISEMFWEMLEEQYKGNRKIQKNSFGKIFPCKENLQAMGSYYYTAMLLKEESNRCDPKLLNKNYGKNQSKQERYFQYGEGI